LDIEKEFLIAVANNSTSLINNLDSIIDEILTYDILKEDEIRKIISKKQIISVIQMLTNYSIFRFVNECSESIIECFDDQFMNVDLKKVLIETNKQFENYEFKMFEQTKNKLWIEVLRTCCFYYIRRLLFIKRKPKSLQELTNKIKEDIKFLNAVFAEKLGENTIKENTKNLEKFLEFLETPVDMISFACYGLRECNGSTCNFDMVKSLIELRFDLNSADKKSATQTCREVLENYKDDDNSKKNNPLLEYIVMERKNLGKRKSITEGLESIEESEQSENNKNKTKSYNLSDFLGDFGEVAESVDATKDLGDQEKNSIGPGLININFTKKNDEAVVTDIICEGEMMKKSNSRLIYILTILFDKNLI